MPSPGPTPAVTARAAALCCLLAAAALAAAARGQAPEPSPLRLGGVVPTGARTSATESWGSYGFELTNFGDTDRQARVLVFFPERPDVQYGRDVWVPAHARLSDWLLAGPATAQRSSGARDLRLLFYDRTDGAGRLLLERGGEIIHNRSVPYRKREPFTAVLLDEEAPEEPVPGALPQPDSASTEALRLVRTFRLAAGLSEYVQVVSPGPLPPAVEGLAGIDHFVLASERIADDPAGMQALRRWLEQDGTLWVMLDRVRPELLAPLLGDALDFEVVDRVSLTSFRLQAPASGRVAGEGPAQEHERPVELVRVLLPRHERPRHAINGWPAWFTRPVGRGKVVFTALGPRGWYRPRTLRDRPAPFEHYPGTPFPSEPLNVVAGQLHQPPDEGPFHADAFRAPLAGQIGYAVVSRGAVALVFGGFVAITAALGLALRRSRRPELLGWLAPAAALVAAAAFIALGESSRRAAPPTLAVAQVVEAAPGMTEAPARGLLAAYRPDSGPAEARATAGGFFQPDLTGAEGQAHRFLLTDRGTWHWENLDLPAGVRWAPFHTAVPTREPVEAVARLGPDGIEGKLTAEPFRDLADALVTTPADRNLAVRMDPDGAFRAGGEDVLPAGQFLAGAVLSDRQQRRQRLYREFLRRGATGSRDDRDLLLAWAEPADTHFELAAGARRVGTALLAVPLRLEAPAPGVRVTIPAPLVPYHRMLDGKPIRAPREARGSADMDLRFRLPAAVLPFRVEGARLAAKITAPSRRVTIAGQADGGPVELYRAESPLDPIRIDIADPRLLGLDAEGGLRLNVTVSDLLQRGNAEPVAGPAGDDRWAIEYLELEVTGRAEGE